MELEETPMCSCGTSVVLPYKANRDEVLPGKTYGSQKMELSWGNTSVQQIVGGSLLGIREAKSRAKTDEIKLH